MRNSILMFESWLENYRDSVLQNPKPPFHWKSVKGNITDETQHLLDSLEPNTHEVALFSWHPNIKQAQWSDGYHDRDNSSNYNSRSLIDDSIIIILLDDKKSGYEVVKDAMKQFSYAETLGGNGREKASYQVQISFLKTVGTHQEAEKLKENFTAGAYTYDNEWKYIPSEDFDTSDDIFIELRKTADLLNIFFEGTDIIHSYENTLNKFKTSQPRITVKFKDDRPQLNIELLEKGGKSTEIKITQFGISELGKSVYKDLKTTEFLDAIRYIIKRNPDIIPKLLAKYHDKYAFDEAFDKYISDMRGSIHGKKFNI